MSDVPSLVQELSDALLVVEDRYALEMSDLSKGWFGIAEKEARRLWVRGRQTNANRVIAVWNAHAKTFASAADQTGCEFLADAMDTTWASVVAEVKMIRDELTARGGSRVLAQVRKPAFQHAAILEMQETSTFLLHRFEPEVAEVVTSCVTGRMSARRMSRQVWSHWETMGNAIVSEGRRIEFEMVNALRSDVIERLASSGR